jgi:hypothetical protein
MGKSNTYPSGALMGRLQGGRIIAFFCLASVAKKSVFDIPIIIFYVTKPFFFIIDAEHK